MRCIQLAEGSAFRLCGHPAKNFVLPSLVSCLFSATPFVFTMREHCFFHFANGHCGLAILSQTFTNLRIGKYFASKSSRGVGESFSVPVRCCKMQNKKQMNSYYLRRAVLIDFNRELGNLQEASDHLLKTLALTHIRSETGISDEKAETILRTSDLV